MSFASCLHHGPVLEEFLQQETWVQAELEVMNFQM
jgi:hypothetical protein